MNTELTIELPVIVLEFIVRVFSAILSSSVACQCLLQHQELLELCTDCGYAGKPEQLVDLTVKEINGQTKPGDEAEIKLWKGQWKLVYVALTFTRNCFVFESEQDYPDPDLQEEQCQQMDAALDLVLQELDLHLFGSPPDAIIQ
jgi:hypothetical protein